MDRFESAELNLRMLEQLTTEQILRPEQIIRVQYTLEARKPHVSYHGLYVRHFEADGIWNIELLELTETVHNTDNKQGFSDLIRAVAENTDEAWDAIGRDNVKISLENRKVVRWLGDLLYPVFSLY